MSTPPMTFADFMGLPIGPEYGVRKTEVEPGVFVNVPVVPETRAFFLVDKMIMSVTDKDGVSWSLSQYKDGSFFRVRKS